jgi:putative transcriptional regulator
MDTKLAPGILIASPHLRDPNFAQTVVLLFEHGDKGAVGLVFNRALDIQLAQVIEDLDIPIEPDAVDDAEKVHYGGPVSMEIGWVIHSAEWEDSATRHVSPEVHISTSREVLEAIAGGHGPDRFFLCLGYAGWGGGQLEEEIAQGAWLTLPLDPELVFDVPPDERWRRCFDLLGIDPHQLAMTPGNA